jgi:hypothetical protein
MKSCRAAAFPLRPSAFSAPSAFNLIAAPVLFKLRDNTIIDPWRATERAVVGEIVTSSRRGMQGS